VYNFGDHSVFRQKISQHMSLPWQVMVPRNYDSEELIAYQQANSKHTSPTAMPYVRYYTAIENTPFVGFTWPNL